MLHRPCVLLQRQLYQYFISYHHRLMLKHQAAWLIAQQQTCDHFLQQDLTKSQSTNESQWMWLLTESILRIVSIFQCQHVSDLVVLINNVKVTYNCWMILQVTIADTKHILTMKMQSKMIKCFNYTLQTCNTQLSLRQAPFIHKTQQTGECTMAAEAPQWWN